MYSLTAYLSRNPQRGNVPAGTLDAVTMRVGIAPPPCLGWTQNAEAAWTEPPGSRVPFQPGRGAGG